MFLACAGLCSTKHLREKSEGEEIIRDSRHADSQVYVEQDDPREMIPVLSSIMVPSSRILRC